ncbi:hypothetical protein QFC20_000630 [Naganishia adeliensis]|uniref:Uncharacterized protein n=1 Tax=Naganishia adeliensis TaxID=92952 RepID=A0ACC2WY44_9TREE|nr:hypothetical protein QFC20_000630 [Naganishia adeliensis]
MASYIRIINHLVLEDDPNDPRCGPSAIRLLENSLYHLLVPTSRPLRTRDAFATLLHLADEKINTLPFHAVGAEWLRLYVDATIGLVVAQVLANDDEAPWRECIRKLDMAIVVAGAVGKGRDEVIQRLIKLVQADYAADHLARYRRMIEHETTAQDAEQEPRKRRRITGPQRLHYAANAVPELAPLPSSNAYRTTHHTQPFIIRRFASPSSSPAISHWRSAAYLLSLVGPGRVVPVEIGASYTAKEWGQRIVPFELFLSRIGYDLSGLLPAEEDELNKADELPHGQPLYLAQHALLDQFPMLRPDVGPLPDYIYAEPGAEGYAPPGNEQGLIMNVWVGNGAGAGHGEEADERKGNDSAGPVISPAHTDPYFNCYLQILGEKRVWLAPPDVSDSMYAFPEPEAQDSNSELDDAEGEGDTSSTASGLVTSYTTNTSRVPIFENPDRARGSAYERRYERFYERAFPQSLEAVLEPGDLLVMPPKWLNSET